MKSSFNDCRRQWLFFGSILVIVMYGTTISLTGISTSMNVNAEKYHHQKEEEEKEKEEKEETSSSSCISYLWKPEDIHPCTIEQQFTPLDYIKQFGQAGAPPLYPKPFIIRGGNKDDHKDHSLPVQKQKHDHPMRTSISTARRNENFQYLTQLDTILHSFPKNFTVTLSSSNSFSEHRRTIPFEQYLEEEVIRTGGETLPNQKSNETWYLFGETYSREWNELLQHYEIPTCVACHRNDVALAFGIGNRGSGVQWHVHGAGFSESVHGRKHWIIQQDKPSFHPDQTSRNWMEYNYTSLNEEDRPLECTLYPGDMIYFPDMWWHATINLDKYTAFVSTFTQDHLFVANESDDNW